MVTLTPELLLHAYASGIFPLADMKRYTESYVQAGGKEAFSRYYTADYDSAIFRPALKKNLIVAQHNLATDGDTMEMMRAVLDTNIWLATHVVIVNAGYSATFVVGALWIVCILGGIWQYFFRVLNRDLFLTLNRMMYGILCFAMLCSFVGTVLGGIGGAALGAAGGTFLGPFLAMEVSEEDANHYSRSVSLRCRESLFLFRVPHRSGNRAPAQRAKIHQVQAGTLLRRTHCVIRVHLIEDPAEHLAAGSTHDGASIHRILQLIATMLYHSSSCAIQAHLPLYSR